MDNNFNNNDYRYTSGPNPGQFQTDLSSSILPAGDLGNSKRSKKKKKSKPVHLTRTSLTAVILVCILLSSAFGFGGAMLAGNYISPAGTAGKENTTNANTTGFNLEDATGSSMTVQEITAKAQDSVVEIKTESVQADSWMQQYVTEGAGSGVIIKSNGYIITNNHVIEGASKVLVTTSIIRSMKPK